MSELTLSGGRKVKLFYDALNPNIDMDDRLARVELVDALGAIEDKTSYVYENADFPRFVTGVVDRDGVRRWSSTYQADGRATSSFGPSNVDAVAVDYGASAWPVSTRTVTNALGKVTTYTFNEGRLTGVTGAASANCPSSASSMTYASDLLAQSTDEEGRVTKFTRNAKGQATQTIEGFGTSSARTTNTTWHSTFNVPTQVVEPKATWTYTYDAAGRLTSATQTDTTSYTTPYATNGRTRVWTYDWSATGQLEGIDGPLSGAGDTVSYTYNSSGYLQTVTNEVGQTTTVTSWDWRGAPLTVVDANGVSTTFTYDVRGRMLSATINPGGSQSHYAFEYDAVGDLSKLILPRGGFLEYTYDAARRLVEVENDRGEKQEITPNLMGDPTAVAIKTSGGSVVFQQNRAYDELGRLIQTVGAGSQTWTQGYDKTGNLKSVTDARGKLWQTTFDPLNRVIAETNPESQAVGKAYDAADQLTGHTDGRSLSTTRIVDGFGFTIREVSPDRGTRTYWYDKAGRMTKLEDGDGEVTDYAYDAAGRLLTATHPGASWETTTYTYDSTSGGNKGVGRLTGVTEASGATALTYDAQGRVTGEAKTIESQTYAVGYAYDANGDISQITLPSGRTVSFTRANDGLITAVSTKATPSSSAQALASSVVHQPFGPLKSLTYGNGLGLTRSHDGNYWLTRVDVSGGGTDILDLEFYRNANGQLEGVADHLATGRGASFGYYDSGRLQYGVGSWGDESYAYDAAGNRTDKRRDVGGVVSYELAQPAGTANQIDIVEDAAANPLRTLSYRYGGDLWRDVRVGGSTYEYAYNAKKRLVAVSVDGVQSATYAYDWLGRRVARSTGVTSPVGVHYVFDREGRLLAEHSAFDGLAIREYVWLDDLPLAVIDGSGAVFYVHAGQLDEPLVMTDAGRAKVWDAYLDPYGKAQVFATAPAALELRLPGQWEQLETGGLFQNWHRDYDPSLGRYIEADPLGLEAGQNLYAYVDGRPTEWVDPDGRNPLAAAFVAARIYCMRFPAQCAAAARATMGAIASAFKGLAPPTPRSTPRRSAAKRCPDDDECDKRWEAERGRCFWFRDEGMMLREDIRGCLDRAAYRHGLCLKHGFPAPDDRGGPYEWNPRYDGQRFTRRDD